MLNNIIEEEDDCFVFFYEEVDPEAHAILAELEGDLHRLHSNQLNVDVSDLMPSMSRGKSTFLAVTHVSRSLHFGLTGGWVQKFKDSYLP